METLTIQVPEKKSKLVKSLLKELGVTIETETSKLAAKLDAMMPDGEVPTMDEIVAEIHAHRAGK